MSTSLLRALFALSSAGILGVVPTTRAAAAKHATRSAGSTEINEAAFRSAVVIDAASGKVLFEDRADVQNPPASVTKLMTFYVIHDKIQRGELTLQTPVTITADAARMGGSEAWLMHKEKVMVEQLLYLLMVPSANDAAMALAIQVTGSKEGFVELMNAKARELGMTRTSFHSPHGLPPGKGQEADLSTARDIALLCRELISKTDVLHYSSTRHYEFRHANGVVNQFDNHDHLLGLVPGCDGLKTGWYPKAGYSIATTVQRSGRRIIAVVLGSPERKLRDTVATRLIERGFAALPPPVAAAPAANVDANRPSTISPTAPGTSATATASPAPADGANTSGNSGSSSVKLVPLTPEEQKSFPAGTDSSDTVHVDFGRNKK